MIEKIIFNLLAFPLFIIVFFKFIQKNDTSYIYALIGQAIGIAISFIELITNSYFGAFLKAFTYIFAIMIPFGIVYIEYKNILSFTEVFHIGIANVYQFFRNYKGAKKALIALVTKDNNSYLGHKMLAEIYEKEGGARKAIDEYVKVIDINKKDYKSYFRIAQLLYGLDKKEEAAQMLNNLLNKKPEYYDATILLGEILCEQGKFKDALNVYFNGLKYNPNDYDLYYNLGIAYTNLNDFQNAKVCYQKAASLNAILHKVNYNLGQIALIYDDLDEAERYFTESLKAEEVEAISYYQLARIYMLKGEHDKAINFVNLAIELDISLKEKFDNDPIFIPIKVYMTIKEGEVVDNKKRMLSLKEQKTMEHMEKTYYLVGRLSYDGKRNVKSIEQLKQEKEQEEKERE